MLQLHGALCGQDCCLCCLSFACELVWQVWQEWMELEDWELEGAEGLLVENWLGQHNQGL